MDRQDRPWLGYYDARGKTVFRFGCGTHSRWMRSIQEERGTGAHQGVDHDRQPQDADGLRRLHLRPGPENWPPNTTWFNQPDLGYPELDADKWRALENRFLDLLGSGWPLTISAEGKSYVLPPLNVPRWRARFQKIC